MEIISGPSVEPEKAECKKCGTVFTYYPWECVEQVAFVRDCSLAAYGAVLRREDMVAECPTCGAASFYKTISISHPPESTIPDESPPLHRFFREPEWLRNMAERGDPRYPAFRRAVAKRELSKGIKFGYDEFERKKRDAIVEGCEMALSETSGFDFEKFIDRQLAEIRNLLRKKWFGD